MKIEVIITIDCAGQPDVTRTFSQEQFMRLPNIGEQVCIDDGDDNVIVGVVDMISFYPEQDMVIIEATEEILKLRHG